MLSFAVSRITLLVVFLLFLYQSYKCNAKEDAQLCSRRCGIHNITHPFRLQDSPDTCGDTRYNLSCEDNQLLLYLGFGKYYVKSINYNNYTIRLVDVNIRPHDYSSLPRYSLGLYNFSLSTPYTTYQDSNSSVKSLLYWSCPNGVDSSLHNVNENPICVNTWHAVIIHDESLRDLGIGDSCRIEFMYITSWPNELTNGNVSCAEIRHMLLYGFELSWLSSFCKDREFGYLDDNSQHRCFVFPAYVALFCGVKFVLGAPCITVLFIYKWRRRHLSMYHTIEDFLRSDYSIMPIRYSYKDIKRITGHFKTKLGNGGYGSVFKGQLRSGRFVAVKMLDKANANGQDFINEVATIGRIHHVNVVQLIGFCVEGSKRALIYEFMPNGSLEKYIFSNEERSSLSCENFHAIALGVAHGIEYLHNGCNMKILHFDIKPHNILLDENFNPKVSDFGLARLYPTDNSIVSLTAARGTIGYMAPELFYRNVGTISYKADVYSFGMLLMEMASRRKNLNALAEQSSQIYFPFWVYDRLQDEREITIENDTEEEIKLTKKMMIVALWCIQTRPDNRPSMVKVLEMLEEDKELQMPSKLYLYLQDLAAEDIRDHSSSRSSSDISTND
ncbi:rust resistance kinase Lr10-like isoform X2 [Abrus precatorius]|uniref:Rust resistance kinase Lr10-like isoform X2 n=1 Tax=Abrus precatorius TaxID=3816 RepID=A0A8B8MHE6_ABRPR|nr:rust resistance kinase Lr10-like isoform X2 [Abrus precatorius]